jgi:hypothetical protein
MTRGVCTATVLFLGVLTQAGYGQTAGTKPGEHPLKAAIKLASQAHEAATELGDYRAVFSKREMVKGRMFASQMQIKLRHEPFSVYLRFINPEHAGREVLFVEGQNNNQMLAHDTGLKALVGTVPLDPQGEMALAEARYPVTRIGMRNLSKAIVTQWERESEFGETEVKYYPEAKLGEQPVLVIESSHPTPRKQFKFALTRLWLDKETRLPVRVQQYDFPPAPGGQPVLVEEYTYTNVEPNVRLTDADFDRRNPAYQF